MNVKLNQEDINEINTLLNSLPISTLNIVNKIMLVINNASEREDSITKDSE